jgi:hypothetical protein
MGLLRSFKRPLGILGWGLVLFWVAVEVLDWWDRGQSALSKIRLLAPLMPEILDELASPWFRLATVLVGLLLIAIGSRARTPKSETAVVQTARADAAPARSGPTASISVRREDRDYFLAVDNGGCKPYSNNHPYKSQHLDAKSCPENREAPPLIVGHWNGYIMLSSPRSGKLAASEAWVNASSNFASDRDLLVGFVSENETPRIIAGRSSFPSFGVVGS